MKPSTDKAIRHLCSAAAVLVVILFTTAAGLGQRLVVAIYERRAPEVLNRLMESAGDRPLSVYIEKFNFLLWTGGILVALPTVTILLAIGLLPDDARSKFFEGLKGVPLYLKARWQKIYFLSAISLAVFALGMYSGVAKKFPYDLIVDAQKAAEELFETADLINRHPHKISAQFRSGGINVIDSDALQPGLNFIAMFLGERYQLVLMDNLGKIVHTWTVPTNSELPDRKSDTVWILPDELQLIHGAYLFEDGDVLFNFENIGMVRIDRCSRIEWALDASTHHAVAVESDGTIWAPSRKLIRTKEEALPRLRVPYWDDVLLQLTPDGDIVSRISLTESIFDSSYEGILFGGAQDFPDFPFDDPLHLNDVDIVNEALASRLSRVSAGDLLLSLRTINALLIIDRETHEVLWSLRGPFLRQHDPEILSDGSILIYDNRTDLGQHNGAVYLTEPQTFGYSRILRIDPATQEILWSYQGSLNDPFYSSIMGKHQALPNGNLLIVESEGGRIFELETERRQVVWEYVNALEESPDLVGRISEAERLPRNKLNFIGQQCGTMEQPQ